MMKILELSMEWAMGITV